MDDGGLGLAKREAARQLSESLRRAERQRAAGRAAATATLVGLTLVAMLLCLLAAAAVVLRHLQAAA